MRRPPSQAADEIEARDRGRALLDVLWSSRHAKLPRRDRCGLEIVRQRQLRAECVTMHLDAQLIEDLLDRVGIALANGKSAPSG